MWWGLFGVTSFGRRFGLGRCHSVDRRQAWRSSGRGVGTYGHILNGLAEFSMVPGTQLIGDWRAGCRRTTTMEAKVGQHPVEGIVAAFWLSCLLGFRESPVTLVRTGLGSITVAR